MMVVVVVHVLMVPQGLLIITLIIIIHVATTPPDKDVSMLMYLLPLLKISSFHMIAIISHLIRQGQDNHI